MGVIAASCAGLTRASMMTACWYTTCRRSCMPASRQAVTASAWLAGSAAGRLGAAWRRLGAWLRLAAFRPPARSAHRPWCRSGPALPDPSSAGSARGRRTTPLRGPAGCPAGRRPGRYRSCRPARPSGAVRSASAWSARCIITPPVGPERDDVRLLALIGGGRLGARAVFVLVIGGKPPAPDDILRREGRRQRRDDCRRRRRRLGRSKTGWWRSRPAQARAKPEPGRSTGWVGWDGSFGLLAARPGGLCGASAGSASAACGDQRSPAGR